MVKKMKKSKSGFTALNALIAFVVLLMTAVLVLKVFSDRNIAKLEARRGAARPASDMEAGQPLPEAAGNIPSADTPAPAGPAVETVKVPVDASENDCLLAFSDSPESLLRHLDENFHYFFAYQTGAREDGAMFDLFSDYAVCSILAGGRFPDTENLKRVSVMAGYYEFLNSSLNNTPEDGACARFVKEAFTGGGEVVSPDFCSVAAAALSKRTAPSCRRLGDIKDCEGGFVFLQGRNACRSLEGRGQKECLLSAALSSGRTASPEGWLPKVMRSRSPEACVPLAKKLAVGYCGGDFRRRIVTEMRERKAADDKRIAEGRKRLKEKAGRGR